MWQNLCKFSYIDAILIHNHFESPNVNPQNMRTWSAKKTHIFFQKSPLSPQKIGKLVDISQICFIKCVFVEDYYVTAVKLTPRGYSWNLSVKSGIISGRVKKEKCLHTQELLSHVSSSSLATIVFQWMVAWLYFVLCAGPQLLECLFCFVLFLFYTNYKRFLSFSAVKRFVSDLQFLHFYTFDKNLRM
jgi:hypothetical protein